MITVPRDNKMCSICGEFDCVFNPEDRKWATMCPKTEIISVKYGDAPPVMGITCPSFTMLTPEVREQLYKEVAVGLTPAEVIALINNALREPS